MVLIENTFKSKINENPDAFFLYSYKVSSLELIPDVKNRSSKKLLRFFYSFK